MSYSVEIVECDRSTYSFPSTLEQKIARESISFNEYKMKCEVAGIEPNDEECWHVEHCGGIVLKVPRGLMASHQKLALADLSLVFKDDSDNQFSRMFKSWLNGLR